METTPKLVPLEADLHTAATGATGLKDFGADDYREGLKILLKAFDTEPKLTGVGYQFAYGSILGTLSARLLTQAGWAKHPEYRDVSIVKPLIITGIPRTGTTALHKMLSMDPQFQGLEHWLTETPMVRPARSTWDSLPEYRASVANLKAFFSIMPEMRIAHDMVADEVDECLEVLRQSFNSNRFGSSAYVPTYDAWFFKQSELGSYRYYADVVRLIGAGEPRKRWLLKNPGHVAQMAALFSVFPDACVVHTHRDPVKAIPSLCSTLHMARRMFEGDAARADLIGARECSYWSAAIERTNEIRQARPAQFFDVDHRRFVADPMGQVRSLYAHFQLEMAPAAEAAMKSWIAADQSAPRKEHLYKADTFGISSEQIKRTFADYRRRHQFD